MDNLIVGRIVHVVATHQDTARYGADAPVYTKCQAAIVVAVWSPSMINAVVWRDGGNDDRYDGCSGQLSRWVTSVEEGMTPQRFHEPSKCTVVPRSTGRP